jgi:hypothetical protein
MNTIEALNERLLDVARVLQEDSNALALLGLGSVGLELDRLDEWSDLDFFVIVKQGSKHQWLSDPSWLAKAHPVSYLFRNTPDGFKLLFEDGIFGEMAVFEPQELATIPYAEGRVIWSHNGFNTEILKPNHTGGRLQKPASTEFVLGELITCLYVGLCRYRRGETLSAWRFIQNYCLDRVLELAEVSLNPGPGHADPYNRDRRFEDRYGEWTPVIQGLLQGYKNIPESALFLVNWVEQTFGINQAMKAQIVQLATQDLGA